jgi:hypothetical protein
MAMLAFLLLACASCSGITPRPVDPSTPILVAVCDNPGESPRFAFRSSFWLNLHNYLYKDAKRRSGIDDDGPGARGNMAADTASERPLSADERETWRRAVRSFHDNLLVRHSRDSIVIHINDRIADATESGDPALAPEDSTVRDLLAEAAPVYRAVWWPSHERRNRQWANAMEGLLAHYLGCLGPRAAAVFRSEWPPVPIRVDASVYANWFGAYTTTAAGPHVTMSSDAAGNLELYGLETLLHEGVHAARMLRSVDSALAAEGSRQRARIPPELPHLLLFYTAGALVREVVPTHVPYAERFGIWSQSRDAERLHIAIAEEWGPYVRGRRSFEDALRGLVARTRVRGV